MWVWVRKLQERDGYKAASCDITTQVWLTCVLCCRWTNQGSSCRLETITSTRPPMRRSEFFKSGFVKFIHMIWDSVFSRTDTESYLSPPELNWFYWCVSPGPRCWWHTWITWWSWGCCSEERGAPHSFRCSRFWTLRLRSLTSLFHRTNGETRRRSTTRSPSLSYRWGTHHTGSMFRWFKFGKGSVGFPVNDGMEFTQNMTDCTL